MAVEGCSEIDFVMGLIEFIEIQMNAVVDAAFVSWIAVIGEKPGIMSGMLDQGP
jgi:hypothetical protein